MFSHEFVAFVRTFALQALTRMRTDLYDCAQQARYLEYRVQFTNPDRSVSAIWTASNAGSSNAWRVAVDTGRIKRMFAAAPMEAAEAALVALGLSTGNAPTPTPSPSPNDCPQGDSHNSQPRSSGPGTWCTKCGKKGV